MINVGATVCLHASENFLENVSDNASFKLAVSSDWSEYGERAFITTWGFVILCEWVATDLEGGVFVRVFENTEELQSPYLTFANFMEREDACLVLRFDEEAKGMAAAASFLTIEKFVTS